MSVGGWLGAFAACLQTQLQSGMGEALSEDLVKRGWQVAMADIQPNGELSGKLGEDASFHRCDVADYDSQAACFQEVFDKYGRIDALCANAGIVDKRYLPLRLTECFLMLIVVPEQFHLHPRSSRIRQVSCFTYRPVQHALRGKTY